MCITYGCKKEFQRGTGPSSHIHSVAWILLTTVARHSSTLFLFASFPEAVLDGFVRRSRCARFSITEVLANINSRLSLIWNKWKLQGRDNGLLWRQEHGRKKLWSFVLETGDRHPWGPTSSAAPSNRDGRVDMACLGSHSHYSPWGASTKKALLLCNQWQKGKMLSKRKKSRRLCTNSCLLSLNL